MKTRRCDGFEKPGCTLSYAHAGHCQVGGCSFLVTGADDLERRCVREFGHGGACSDGQNGAATWPTTIAQRADGWYVAKVDQLGCRWWIAGLGPYATAREADAARLAYETSRRQSVRSEWDMAAGFKAEALRLSRHE